eukprot:1942133-Pyramimonas_sp.AAC.1
MAHNRRANVSAKRGWTIAAWKPVSPSVVHFKKRVDADRAQGGRVSGGRGRPALRRDRIHIGEDSEKIIQAKLRGGLGETQMPLTKGMEFRTKSVMLYAVLPAITIKQTPPILLETARCAPAVQAVRIWQAWTLGGRRGAESERE